MATSIKSYVQRAQVVHARVGPLPHSFNYGMLLHVVELTECGRLGQASKLFGYNRARPFSIHDQDYLTRGKRPVWEKLGALLLERGNCVDLSRVILVTTARYFGLVFNPVNFYFCYEGERFRSLVVEINNTYSERAVYVIDCDSDQCRIDPARGFRSFHLQKEFYVSPFLANDYTYAFQFADVRDNLDVRINLLRHGELAFVSRVWGSGQKRAIGTTTHARMLVEHPLTPALTMPRILFQAAFLYFRKGLSVQPKPNPVSSKVVWAEPYSWLDQLCQHLIFRQLRKLQRGRLVVELPGGNSESFGCATVESGSAAVTIKINNFRLFRRVIFSGGLGLGEAYVDGDWETNDLTALIALFLDNAHVVEEQKINSFKPTRWLHRFRHWLRRNSLSGSRRNIKAHYDLSNELFQLFLDPTLTYSCAYFPSGGESLEEAQLRKREMIAEKARLNKSDQVLEVGSGWGAWAIEAARHTGCFVRSITVSEEQLRLANERAVAANLADRVRFEFLDYRKVDGCYDKIVSIEMLEAVGHENLAVFFQMCARCLSPDGLVVLQFIAMPDQYYSEYLGREDFIQKHIFPGSHLPSLGAVLNAAHNNSELIVESIENIGPHYARTLAEWRRRFNACHASVKQLGYDDRFIRLWNYYLASCEAEFATRWLSVYQLVLARPNNRTLRNSSSSLTRLGSGRKYSGSPVVGEHCIPLDHYIDSVHQSRG